MKPPENENGGGARTPTPDTVAFKAAATSHYLADQPESKANAQSLAVPRPLIELCIQIAIEWLDMIDSQAEPSNKQAEAPESVL